MIEAIGRSSVANDNKPGLLIGLRAEDTPNTIPMQEPAPSNAESRATPTTSFGRIVDPQICSFPSKTPKCGPQNAGKNTTALGTVGPSPCVWAEYRTHSY